MRIAMSTGCLYKYPMSEIFRIAKTAGFDGIELLIDRQNSDVDIRYVQELSVKYDIPVLSLHSPFSACDGWGGFWDRIWRSLNIAMELSVALMNFHPPDGFIIRHRLNNELSERIKVYKSRVGSSNIILTVENLPAIRYIRPLIKFLPFLKDNVYQVAKFARDNDIGVTFDTTHIGTMSMDILEVYDTFKDRVANIHLSDYDGRSQHLLPGKGRLPLGKFLAQVGRENYNGIITLETCPSAMEESEKALQTQHSSQSGIVDIAKAERNAKLCLSYIKGALSDR